MKKVLTLFVVLFFLLQGKGNGQLYLARSITDNLANYSSNELIDDSVLMKLRADNDLVIGFSTYNYNWNVLDQYNLLLLKDNIWTGIRYNRRWYFQKRPLHEWDTVSVEKSQVDSILTIIKKNKGWELNCPDCDKKICPQASYNKPGTTFCDFSDGSSKRFIIMTKTNLLSAAFYLPEEMEKCCPGWPERKRFLEIIKSIAAAFQ